MLLGPRVIYGVFAGFYGFLIADDEKCVAKIVVSILVLGAWTKIQGQDLAG